MKWSPQQAQALKCVRAWLAESNRKPVFKLFGFAGTGKTTLARHIAEQTSRRVFFCAFTGKAASVLRSKGCENACTIHSLIYRLVDEKNGQPRFERNPESALRGACLVIVDEASMVDEELAGDLLSFNVPILALGDPAQLPPVRGTGVLTAGEPDMMLTEIHRQARESPIIHLATTVREGGRLVIGAYGEARIIGRHDVTEGDVLSPQQVLVGMNKTRRAFNAEIRKAHGRTVNTPEPGDRLVCLRSNRTKGLLNGGLWDVRSVLAANKGYAMSLSAEEPTAIPPTVLAFVRREFFAGKEGDLSFFERKRSDEFDFGNVLTVHKSQGSQWGDVILFDESGVFRENRNRWLYTGITRAARKLTVVTG